MVCPEQCIPLGMRSAAVGLAVWPLAVCVWDEAHGYGAASEPVWSS